MGHYCLSPFTLMVLFRVFLCFGIFLFSFAVFWGVFEALLSGEIRNKEQRKLAQTQRKKAPRKLGNTISCFTAVASLEVEELHDR